MWGLNKNQIRPSAFGLQALLILLGMSLLLPACKKENVFVYEVNDVSVEQPGAHKPNVKTDNEFISIAYSDLFASTIPQSELDNLSLSYKAFGDKRVIIDMIIRNFLNDTNAQIPTDSQMRSDVAVFATECFRKFLVRDPNEFEKWFVTDKITKNQSINPELVYYAFMTCNEYRYY